MFHNHFALQIQLENIFQKIKHTNVYMNRVWSEQLYDLCSKREKSAQKCDEVNIDMDIGTSKKEGRHIGCVFSLPSWHVAPVHGAVHEQVNVLSPSVQDPPLPQGSVLQSSIFSEQSSPVNPALQIHSSCPVAVSTHSPWLLHVDASHTKSKHQQFRILYSIITFWDKMS